MAQYALSSRAFGFCDRCGQRYDLKDLKYQVVNRIETGLRVCDSCLDIDHEQLRLDELHPVDPMTLNDPRPDRELTESRAFFGWNPVGPVPSIKVKVGRVTVTTS